MKHKKKPDSRRHRGPRLVSARAIVFIEQAREQGISLSLSAEGRSLGYSGPRNAPVLRDVYTHPGEIGDALDALDEARAILDARPPLPPFQVPEGHCRCADCQCELDDDGNPIDDE